MTFNAAAVNGLFNAVVTDALTTGLFESVNTHEPKNAPGNGLTCWVHVSDVQPVRTSGLDQTSGLVSFFVEIYCSMLQEPQDDIDPMMLSAASVLMGNYSGDFTLAADTTADVRHVDLLGAYGTGLSVQGGYKQIGDKLERVMVVYLPVVINDMWLQEV